MKAGEEVVFTAEAEVPDGAGSITEAKWSFEGEQEFTEMNEPELRDNGQRAAIQAKHTYEKPGTYFAVIRVASERNGNKKDIFTQVRNLERVRVVVE